VREKWSKTVYCKLHVSVQVLVLVQGYRHDTSNTLHAECSGGVPQTVRELLGNFTLSGEWSPCTSKL